MHHPRKTWGGLTGIDITNTDGGMLRQILISNVTMEDVQAPIHIRLGNRLGGQAPKFKNLLGDSIPQFIFEDVTISNVFCKNAGPYPVIVAGNEGHPVKRITLRDITMICGRPGTNQDIETAPNWKANSYPGISMYRTHLPAYGLVSNFTEDLLVENFKAIPAEGEVRPKELHLNQK